MDKLYKWVDFIPIIIVLYVLLHLFFFMEYRVVDENLHAQAPRHKIFTSIYNVLKESTSD